jgi:ubiquinone/menaquinone biosynthesis C-methylase UbiE
MREMTPVTVARMVALNRKMWNDISDNWQKRQDGMHHDGRFFGRGGTMLSAPVRRLMGAVRGKSLLDMQCGSGEAALSWCNLGARVTGVDLSELRLAEARKKAAVAGRRIAYARGNVVRLPFRAGTFDRIYTGGGITAWIPDARRWAREIARVLKRGGRFLYDDRHPIAAAMHVSRRGVPGVLRSRGGYFDTRPLTYNSMSAWMKRPGRLPQAERNWTLADLVNALGESGLRLVRLLELPVGRWFNGKDLPRDYRGSFPEDLIMRWDKPR